MDIHCTKKIDSCFGGNLTIPFKTQSCPLTSAQKISYQLAMLSFLSKLTVTF